MSKIYFCGIGGISMSAIARLMITRGHTVLGSDERETDMVKKLIDDGISVNIGQFGENIDASIDIFVYTSAINDKNEELLKAEELNLEIYSRAQFLGMIMKDYKHSVAVSGAHGKTSTTGMLSSILINAKADPTIFLGGEMDLLDGNIRVGRGDVFLTEACEYKRNFLNFNPTIALVLNIDEDHLDYYRDIKDIESAFISFVDKVPKDGFAVVNYEFKNVFEGSCEVCKADSDGKFITFGLNSDADFYGKIIELVPFPKFQVYYDGELQFVQELRVFGEHSVVNALGAIASAEIIGISKDDISVGLEKFTGTKRRFEYRGDYKGIRLIDDYAHHPNEIITSLKTAHDHCSGKVITIFQSHTYTRTYELLDKFADVFRNSDVVVFTPIYPAREPDTGLVSGRVLAERTKENNPNAHYADSFKEAMDMALKFAEKGDMIICMGAGEQNKIIDMILEKK